MLPSNWQSSQFSTIPTSISTIVPLTIFGGLIDIKMKKYQPVPTGATS
jgi:hypothetical protein